MADDFPGERLRQRELCADRQTFSAQNLDRNCHFELYSNVSRWCGDRLVAINLRFASSRTSICCGMVVVVCGRFFVPEFDDGT
jgi:hypothetical protein